MLTRRTVLTATLAAAATPFSVMRPSFAQQLTKEEVFFDKDAPVLGNPNGDVTVVEFFDYQCPYCKKAHPMVKDVVNTVGNVRLILKDWPIFGDASIFAAQAVLAAAQIGKYQIAMRALMKTKGKLSHDDVEKTLTGAGLSMEALTVAVNKYSAKISGLLDRNYSQALAFNFAGTPSFVIGSAIFPGVLDEVGLKEAITKARG